MVQRIAKNSEVDKMKLLSHAPASKIPWKRDSRGHPISREPVTSCVVCNKLIYDSVDTKKVVICGKCVQAMLGMDEEKRSALRSRIRENIKAGEV